jgi:hypothetical protein
MTMIMAMTTSMNINMAGTPIPTAMNMLLKK